MCEVYSAEERRSVLDLIIDQAKADERIDGCILVGSGSYGFADQYSDIDICMVTGNKIDIPDLSNDWKEKVGLTLDSQGNVYLVGTARWGNINYHACLLKYDNS